MVTTGACQYTYSPSFSMYTVNGQPITCCVSFKFIQIGLCDVYADVFDHPPLQLASQCPVWSDMLPVDTVAQLREHWLVASVVAGQSHHCMTARF